MPSVLDGWLIKAGQILTQYQRQLSHGNMTAIYNSGRLPWGQRYCQVLASMARNPALRDPKLLQMLPSSIAALEVIVTLLSHTFCFFHIRFPTR